MRLLIYHSCTVYIHFPSNIFYEATLKLIFFSFWARPYSRQCPAFFLLNGDFEVVRTEIFPSWSQTTKRLMKPVAQSSNHFSTFCSDDKIPYIKNPQNTQSKISLEDVSPKLPNFSKSTGLAIFQYLNVSTVFITLHPKTIQLTKSRLCLLEGVF